MPFRRPTAGGTEGGLVGCDGKRPVDSGGQTLAAGLDIMGHAVQRGQQLSGGQPQVQRHDAGMSEPVRDRGYHRRRLIAPSPFKIISHFFY